MTRNVCITACDGQTGFLIAELLLTHPDFNKTVNSITGLTLHPQAAKSKELKSLGATIVHHVPGKERDMVNTLKDTNCDTICLIPPTHKEKLDIVQELVAAATKANIQNCLFMSSAGCDLAERDKQPRLREFVDMEALVLSSKGDPKTELGHSPCIIRAGFYAENILLYAPQVSKEGILPLPIGENHKFAPVALGDVAQLAAHVLSGKGKHGFDDRHRGQLMVCTGPMLAAGKELASAASKALGVTVEFGPISASEAKKVLHQQASSHDDSEKQYLLEYYSLVREGKTNYISTTAFHDVTGAHPQEPDQFFETYAAEFQAKHGNKKRKLEKQEDGDDI